MQWYDACELIRFGYDATNNNIYVSVQGGSSNLPATQFNLIPSAKDGAVTGIGAVVQVAVQSNNRQVSVYGDASTNTYQYLNTNF